MKDYIKSLFLNNLPLKLLSVALAVILWLIAQGYIGK
jgi:hypothetical protein